MVLMSITMFILGVLALFDAFFNYGSLFRIGFAGMLIMLSVWVFIKTKDIGDLSKRETIITQDNSTEGIIAENSQPEESAKRKKELVHQ